MKKLTWNKRVARWLIAGREGRKLKFGTDGSMKYTVELAHGRLVVRIADFEGGGR